MIYIGMDKEVSTGTENNAHLASLNFLPRLRSYRDVKRPFFSHNLISCSRFFRFRKSTFVFGSGTTYEHLVGW